MSDGSRSYDDPDEVDGRIHAEFDWSDTRPHVAVVRTVAAAANRRPTDLEPLSDSVDTDALDALSASRDRPATDGSTRLSVTYAGYEVTVRSDGKVVATPTANR